MKKITINGRTFEYEVTQDQYCYWHTNFYDSTIEVTKRKFIFFGPRYTVFEPKFVFKVYGNIEDVRYTKEDVKKLINTSLALYDRKLEIEKGQII